MEELEYTLSIYNLIYSGTPQYQQAKCHIRKQIHNINNTLNMPTDYQQLLNILQRMPLMGISLPNGEELKQQIVVAMPRRRLRIIPVLLFKHTVKGLFTAISYLMPENTKEIHMPNRSNYFLSYIHFPQYTFHYNNEQLLYNRLRIDQIKLYTIWECVNAILDLKVPDTYIEPEMNKSVELEEMQFHLDDEDTEPPLSYLFEDD